MDECTLMGRSKEFFEIYCNINIVSLIGLSLKDLLHTLVGLLFVKCAQLWV